jgi:hypothetical protein
MGNHLEVVKISTLALKKVWVESQEKYPLGYQHLNVPIAILQRDLEDLENKKVIDARNSYGSLLESESVMHGWFRK